MTAKTFTSAGVNNLWSNAANWDLATVPVDNDSVTIPLGQTCEFDVDQSSFNGIAGIVNTGMLKLTRNAGTYYMKIKAGATISGTGTFDCGTALDPIPFAAKHTITGGTGWYINGASGLTMTVYAAEPTIKYVKLTQAEAIGATVLHVDTDVTGDIWADGNSIYVSSSNVANINEKKIIASGGITANTITLTAGLTNAMPLNSVVSLINRNVIFLQTGSGNSIFSAFADGKLVIAGGEASSITSGIIFNNCSAFISGGYFYNTLYVFAYISTIRVEISGGIFVNNANFTSICNGFKIMGGAYIGNGTVFNAHAGLFIGGGYYFGNKNIVVSSIGVVVAGGEFVCNGRGHNRSAFESSSCNFKNAIFGSNYADIYLSSFLANNTLFGSSTEVLSYTSLSFGVYSESIDHDQIAGSYKAWTKGGVTSSQAVTLPVGYTTAMQTVLENAAAEGYWQKEYTIGAGASIKFTSNLRKASSMSYLPRVQIFNKALTDPFAGGTPLHIFTMSNSIDTWESEVWTYTNSGTADVTLVIRTQGMAASGTFYSAVKAEQINVDLTTALANIAAVDTVVDAIKVKTDALPGSILASTVEGTYTVQDVLKIMAAILAGKVTGGGTTSIAFRDLSDTLNRVVATVDSSGNRTDVTKTLT